MTIGSGFANDSLDSLVVRRPTATTYMGHQYMLICAKAHDWHVFSRREFGYTPAEPLPTNCGICGDLFLTACEKCDFLYELRYFDFDFHSCGASIPWAAARKELEEADRTSEERAKRGPTFGQRLWTRGVQEAVIEGTHAGLRNGLVAFLTFLTGVLIGALSPLGNALRDLVARLTAPTP